ncbi:MAG TPA: hypothetical protein VK149_12300 [Sideroxyarcus sp.]|nr:hypothetical protein [Sideroxyarcus sp.]
MKLTEGEKLTPFWSKLKKHLQDELDSARSKLETPSLTHDQSQLLRGEIIRLRKMLDMEKQDVVISK